MSQDLPSSPESARPDASEASETSPESAVVSASGAIDASDVLPEAAAEALADPIAAPDVAAESPVEATPDAPVPPEILPEVDEGASGIGATSDPIAPASPTTLPDSIPDATPRVRRLSRRRAPEDDEILPQTLLRLLGEAIVAAQPVLKQQSIKALRGTIRLLEATVARLEAETAPKVQRKAPAPGTVSESALPPTSESDTGDLAPPSSTAELPAKFRSLWQQSQRQWNLLLKQVRARLPESANQTLSDQALTGAIAGVLVVLLWVTSALLPDQPRPSAVADAPSTVAPSPSAPIPAPTPIPPVVEAPAIPKPVAISPSPVKPSPPPPLKLTPEQQLIARIQDRVAEISNQYASGLIQSVQANFRGSRLIVNISNDWYGLGRSQQDKLASEILRRTQELDFTKLELVDEAGTLLARSPVVGSEMIILKRINEATEAA